MNCYLAVIGCSRDKLAYFMSLQFSYYYTSNILDTIANNASGYLWVDMVVGNKLAFKVVKTTGL